MVENYDKESFLIEDLYEPKYRKCREYRHKYEEFFAVFDEDDYGADEFETTPDEYENAILGDLQRGERFILMQYSGHDECVTIPDGVTEINARTFQNKTFIKRVIMPDSVKNAGGSLFSGCTALESVRLSQNLTSIGMEMFEMCQSLENVVIPDSVTYIGNNAFDGCKTLRCLVLGRGVKSIGWDAFARCSSLTFVRFNEGLKTLDQALFYDSAVEEIFIPASVTYISPSAFSNCGKLTTVSVHPKNTDYYSKDNCIYIAGTNELLISRSGGALPQDGSVISLGEDAFASDLSLQEIDIPEGVKSIGSAAFRNCKNLRRVTLPQSLEHIGRCSFENCASLQEITVPHGVKQIQGLAFFHSGLRRVVIKRGVELIDDNAFARCANLSEIYIPSTVKTAFSPVGAKYECPQRPLRVYIEKSTQNNYQSWLHYVEDYEVVFVEQSAIFD